MATIVDVTTGKNVIGVKSIGNSASSVKVISGQNRYNAETADRQSSIVDVETGVGAGVSKQYVDAGDADVTAHSDSEDERILAEAKAYTDDRMPYLIQSYITENKDLLRGDDGEPFDVYKTYPTINDMQLDYEHVPVGKFVMISSTVGDVDNGKIYKRVDFGFDFIVSMASIEGPQGEQGPQGEKGDKGDKGDPGEPGSDADVTSENVIEALGYTPADASSVPTKISDLTNDAGFITAVAWADIVGKPSSYPPSTHTHTVSQITDFPTKVSAFTNDAGYLTQHQSLANYYTKSQVDSALSTKADADDVSTLSTSVAGKADASSVYTKAQVNSLLTGKADIGAIPTVPTLISAFTNDRGYITAAQVPEVSSNSIIAALGYTPADEADIPEIPSNVSYFTNDAGYLTSHQSLANYYTKAQVDEALGDKADLTDVPTIPTAVSAFTNDVGYLTQHQSLANYYTKSQTQNQISSAVSSASATLQAAIDLKADASSIPTKVSDLTNDAGYITLAQVPDVSSSSIISALGYTPADSASLTAALIYKGSVSSFGDLPASGNKTGDVYNVVAADGDIPAGTNYAWNGSAWDALGGTLDLSGYVQTSRTVNGKALTSDITLTYSDVGALASDGNAVSATEFSAAKSVTLSGAVTGTASSKAGWSITTVRRSCLVGQSGSTVTNPWYKFATFTISNNNDDREITFLVTDTYTNTGNKFGILRAHFRNDGSKVFSAGSSSLEWLVNSGFDVSQFVMCCNNAAGSTVELWTSIPYAYKFRRFSVISEGARASISNTWTLLNASSAGQAESYTAADNVIVSVNADFTGNASTATKLQTVRTLWGQSFNGSADVSGDMSAVGSVTFSDTAAGDTRNLLAGKMAGNDLFRISVGGSQNNGYLEIATADDGSEPIYVRQYSGVFATLQRTATLLDGSGNTSFPGSVTATGGLLSTNLKGTPSGNQWSNSLQTGKSLVESTATGWSTAVNMPTKNYRVGLGTHNGNNDLVYLYSVTNANVESGTNTKNKELTWNAANGTLSTANFSGNLTGNVTGDVTGNVSGDAGTVNGHTVEKDVPSNAVFTDTNNRVQTVVTNPSSATWYGIAFVGTSAAAQSQNYINDGFRVNINRGTADALGNTYVQLGNGTNKGTDGNQRGVLRIYPETGNFYQSIYSAATLTANQNQVLPATGGTILNTGTTALSNAATSGKKVADLKINGTTTTLYAPPPDNMGAASASAAGSAGLVPAPAAGDQAKVLSGAGTWVTNTGDTHWTTGMVVGASGATANAATTNGGTYLCIKDNSTNRASINIKGTGGASVTSDANGVITINSANNFLPISGGTMTGTIVTSKADTLHRSDKTGFIIISGGNSNDATAKAGARLFLAGADNTELPGGFQVNVLTSSVSKWLVCKSDGTFTWDEKNVVRADTAGVGSADVPVYINSSGVATSTGKSFSDYLPLAGGTMTGNITIRKTSLVKGTAASAQNWYMSWKGESSDSSNNRLCEIRAGYDADLHSYMDLMAYRANLAASESGSNNASYIRIGYPASGTSTYITYAAAQHTMNGWLRALGNIQRKDTGITRGTAPSANRFVYFQHIDNSNTVLAELRMGYLTSKQHQISLRVSNDSGTWYDGLIIACDAAGTAPVVTSVTPAQTDDSTKIATTAYVKDCVPKTVGDANTPVYVNANGVVTSTGKSFANYVPTSRKVNGKALSGDITLTASDVGADASGVGAVGVDNGSLAVGSYVLAAVKPPSTSGSTTVNNGATTEGSNLNRLYLTKKSNADTSSYTGNESSSLSGTWRNVSGVNLTSYYATSSTRAAGLFQRIS